MNFYFLDSANQPQGPVPQQQLYQMLQSGHLHPGSLIAAEGAADWVPLQSILQAPTPVPQQASVHRPQQTRPMPQQKAVNPYQQGHYGASTGQGLPVPILTSLAAQRPWSLLAFVYFLLGMIGVAIMTIATIFLMAKVASLPGQAQGLVVGPAILVGGLVVALIIMGIPTALVWRFSSGLGKLRQYPTEAMLQTVADRQKGYFICLTIFGLLSLFPVIILLIMTVAA